MTHMADPESCSVSVRLADNQGGLAYHKCRRAGSCVLQVDSVDISGDSRPIYRSTIGRLSVDNRPTIGRLSTDYRSIVDRYIGRQSTDKCVDRYSLKPSILDRYMTDTWPILDRYLTDTWPTLDRYLTDTWPILDRYLTDTWPILDRYLTDTWPAVDRYISADSRSIYRLTIGRLSVDGRPICRPSPPIVHMIRRVYYL